MDSTVVVLRVREYSRSIPTKVLVFRTFSWGSLFGVPLKAPLVQSGFGGLEFRAYGCGMLALRLRRSLSHRYIVRLGDPIRV